MVDTVLRETRLGEGMPGRVFVFVRTRRKRRCTSKQVWPW